jgi:hypothetical protein
VGPPERGIKPPCFRTEAELFEQLRLSAPHEGLHSVGLRAIYEIVRKQSSANFSLIFIVLNFSVLSYLQFITE